MNRRTFVRGAVASIAIPRSVAAQPARIPRVGYLFSFTPATGAHFWDACRQGLRELGWVEGRTIIVEPRWADGHPPSLLHRADQVIE